MSTFLSLGWWERNSCSQNSTCAGMCELLSINCPASFRARGALCSLELNTETDKVGMSLGIQALCLISSLGQPQCLLPQAG